jgi:hypothetical protein
LRIGLDDIDTHSALLSIVDECETAGKRRGGVMVHVRSCSAFVLRNDSPFRRGPQSGCLEWLADHLQIIFYGAPRNMRVVRHDDERHA